jgi:hypothetical protein
VVYSIVLRFCSIQVWREKRLSSKEYSQWWCIVLRLL